MFRSLQLLLPALLPSWGFFDYIQPSPRIQLRFLDASHTPISQWQEWRPRPTHVSPLQMARRLVWNAHWNETLFAMSCAERIAEQHTRHSEQQILKCIVHDWQRGVLTSPIAADAVQFRLMFVQRQLRQLVDEQRFLSQITQLERSA